MCRKEVGRERDINKPNVRKPQLFFSLIPIVQLMITSQL